MTEKIRVLLVDDHVLFRSGVRALLERHDDFEVVDEAGDGLEGIKRARSLKPDLALAVVAGVAPGASAIPGSLTLPSQSASTPGEDLAQGENG